MPFFTTSELAKDYGMDPEVIYSLAGRIDGFFPDYKVKAKNGHHSSLYSLYKHRMFGKLLELAPGTDLNSKLGSLLKGYRLSEDEKKMLYQSMTSNDFQKLTSQVSEIWQAIQNMLNRNQEPAPASQPFAAEIVDTIQSLRTKHNERYDSDPSMGNPFAPITVLPCEYEGLSPSQAFDKAKQDRVLNPQHAANLARRDLEDQAWEDVIHNVADWGSSYQGYVLSGDDLIRWTANSWLKEEFKKKGSAWRRFRLRLINDGFFEARPNGFLWYTGKTAK